ncbi:MAG: phosphate ABC transporter permease family protein, partial [Magnetospirillum sp.]|nr:phosphate ABC transporter permease family protein [Magnetospirillum sp.]
MQLLTLTVVLLLLTAFGYRLGRSRALATASGNPRLLHSLPSYHGYYVAMWCGLPALVLIAAWLALEPTILHWLVMSSLPADLQGMNEERLALVYNEVRNVARHGHPPSMPAVGEAAQHYNSMRHTMFFAVAAAALALAVAALAYAHRRIH